MSKTNSPVESGPKKFTLAHPLQFRGQRYDEFVAREPKVRDLRVFLRNVEADPILAIEQVLADLCQVDAPVIGDLHVHDFFKMREWLERFLTPPTKHYDE